VLSTQPLLYVSTDVLKASLLKRELNPCLEVDVKTRQRPSTETYVKNCYENDHCVASHAVSYVIRHLRKAPSPCVMSIRMS